MLQQSLLILLLISYVYLLAFDTNPSELLIEPPLAKKVPVSYTVGNKTFKDNYLYLSDKHDAEVIEYIAAENKYTDYLMSTTNGLPSTILIQLEKDSVLTPVYQDCFQLKNFENFWVGDGFVYWRDSGDVYYRSVATTSSCGCMTDLKPEILVEMAEYVNNSAYSMVSYFEVIGDLVAFGLDTTGDENYDLYVVHFPTKTTLLGPISRTYYSARWVKYTDGYWIYYNIVDLKWGVPLSIGRAGPFSNSKSQSITPTHEVIYTESDPSLTTEMYLTNDLQFLFIKIAGLMTSDYKLIITDSNSKITIKSILKRSAGIMYDVEHNDGYFYFKTNAIHDNFAIIRIPDSTLFSPDLTDFTSFLDQGTVVVKGNDDFIEKMEVFQSGLVYWFRKNGQRRLAQINLFPPFSSQVVKQSANVYSITQDMAGDFDGRFYRTFNTTCFTFSNSSFLQPPALFSLDLLTMKTSTLFTQTSPKMQTDYIEKTIYGTTKDTKEPIPISIIYKTTTSFPAPLMILSYGAYGTFIDPTYNSDVFSLVDRNFIWAICHPRGDGDMGARWYAKGKFDFKQNTFDDTNSCIQKLIDEGLTKDGLVILKGRSAGGLVAGNAIVSPGRLLNDLDSKANAVIAHVPFIDPIYDSIDDSIPWTAYERFEWGNPSFDKNVLGAMIKYSPYQNIDSSLASNEKAVYVSSGLNDPRVPYYEPLKFVAKLRLFAGTKNKIMIRVDSGGHFTAHGMNATSEWMAFAISAVVNKIF